MRRVALSAAVLACACTHRTQVRHDPIPPPAVQSMIQRQIRNAVDAGEGDFELRSLRERVVSSPADVDARLELAAAYAKRGYPDLELEHYRLSAARFPESDRAALALAKALHRQHADAEASAGLAGFCRRTPSAPVELFAWVGILADEAGDFPGGEAWHRAALERRPAQDFFHNNLGYNLLLQGDFPSAAGEFRRALELNPQSEIARSNLGIALAADPREAVVQWQSLSDPATAHSNLAAVLIERKQYSEARIEIRKALEFSPKNAAALKNSEVLAALDGTGLEVVPAQDSAWRRVSSVVRRAIGAAPAQSDSPGKGLEKQ